MADVHITPEGLEAVQKELDELISHKRPSIVAKIKAARELGDLSENFEYHAAKNEQGMMEARINELEAIIKNHVILEALYITRPVSIAYLTGLEANPHERLMALAVRGEGATLIVPALEEERARGRATNADVVAWRDGEDAYELVTRELAGFTEVGVEKDHLSLHAAEVITSRTSVSELVDVGPEIKRLRVLTNDDESAKLQRAAVITDQAYEVVISKMRAGQTEVDVALLLASAIGDLGGTLSFPTLIQSGPNSSLPHL